MNLCRWAPRGGGTREDGKGGRGGRTTLFAFGWGDLGVLFGVDEAEVKRLAKAEQFDPCDLESVAKFWLSRCQIAVMSNGKEIR